MSAPVLAAARHLVRVRTTDDADAVADDRADGVIVSSNLVEWRPARLATRLKKAKLPVLFDPVLWRFQNPAWWARAPKPVGMVRGDQDLDQNNKIDYVRLGSAYADGTDIQLVGGIVPPSRDPAAAWARLAHNVVRYQRSRLEDVGGHLLEIMGFDEPLRPAAIVAPYLLARGEQDDEVNRILLVAACEAAAEPVIAHVAVPIERAITRGQLTKAAATCLSVGTAGVLLWIERCTESQLSDRPELLSELRDVVGKLAGTGVPVWHGHGGYDTIALLRGSGLNGIAHQCTWADRGSPAAQAPPGVHPAALTYITGLRETRPVDQAARLGGHLDNDAYRRLYCGCVLCAAFLERGDVALEVLTATKAVTGPRGRTETTLTDAARMANLLHFLLVRHAEVRDLYARSTVDAVVARDAARAKALDGRADHLTALLDRVRAA